MRLKMFCKNCGKEIDETARFCPNCGKSQEIKQEAATPNESASKNKVLELSDLILSKSLLMPKYGTARDLRTKSDWFAGRFPPGSDGYSNAVCLETNILLNSKDIVMALKKSITESCEETAQECTENGIYECWTCGIKEALKDFKNKKIGDFYFIIVAIPEFDKELRCVVKITGTFGKYEYIAGIIYTPVPEAYV